MCSPTEFYKVRPPKVHSINRITKNKVHTVIDDTTLEREKERMKLKEAELLAIQYNRNVQPSSQHI
jgi:hypothetical protein